MSVLVEALCLVVTRRKLDEVYAGGAHVFLERMSDPDLPLRYVCADDHLVCLSFRGLADAVVVSEKIDYVVGVEELIGTPINGALLDHYAGGLRSYDELDYEHQQEVGFMHCWLRGTEPGELIAPPDWTRERSRRLESHLRDELHGATRYCYPVGDSVWVDAAAGEHVPGYSLEPEPTPEQLAREYRDIYFEDFGELPP